MVVRILSVIFFWLQVTAGEPAALFLTWVHDPSTTVSVVWIGDGDPHVSVRHEGGVLWRQVKGTSHTITGTSVVVHRAHLEGLRENSSYLFKIQGEAREYRFQTLPRSLNRELRFVVGGDMFYYGGPELFEKMTRVIARDDPDFVVLGGDLAYVVGSKSLAKSREEQVERWSTFLQSLHQHLRGEGGRLIPLIPVVGNHDVHGRGSGEIFYELFPFPTPGQAYRALHCGDYMDILCLDTGHTSPIEGKQTTWLESTLSTCHAPYLFAVYHIGAYPAVYDPDGPTPRLLRKLWVPLFEEGRMTAAFEHHSHATKRTHSLREGKIDPSGVVYLGDGSWGVLPRKVHPPEERPYLATSLSVNACWFVHLTHKKATLEARNLDGRVVDRITLSPRPVEVLQP